MGLFKTREHGRAVQPIDASAAIQSVRDGAILVDVRTAIEWARGHAPGARHIPLQLISSRGAQLSHDTQIITICQSGHRSDIAARTLARKGFTVSSVTGGMPAWKAAGGAVETN
ncbi:rhodanese-like domain-containing protein [Subtercola frigoramans]|uniref:Rhodanese-related sulfurtransferase n=1 Tax=Subtercola frigoramans TaxID=120298 RepID=A0ABS2L0Z0_9MICO|nr:rhodanese-like domain-containing protein [Subtercola frigoramans]MBM7470747.1 rhodanese-related sulfurtransferase [Subtercola frigoramans]